MASRMLNLRVRVVAVIALLSILHSSDGEQHNGVVSDMEEVPEVQVRTPLHLQSVGKGRGTTRGVVVLLDEAPELSVEEYVKRVEQVAKELGGGSNLNGALLETIESSAESGKKQGDFSNHREHLKKLQKRFCSTGTSKKDKRVCHALTQLIEEIPELHQAAHLKKAPGAQPVKDGAVKEDYARSIGELVQHYCRTNATDVDACKDMKQLQAAVTKGLSVGDLSRYAQNLRALQKKGCSQDSSKKRCKVFQLLLQQMPKLKSPAKDQSPKAKPSEDQSHKVKSPAKKQITAQHSNEVQPLLMPQAIYNSTHLSQEQKAYPVLIQKLVSDVCSKQGSAFCQKLYSLHTLYSTALKQQSKPTFVTGLNQIQKLYCSDPKSQVGSKCQVLVQLREKLPSLAHLGAYALERLTKLHQEYLQTTRDIWKSYCQKKDSTIFCQLCLGLERTYTLSLRARTNHRYESYLTEMEQRFCEFDFPTNQTSRRCQILPILRNNLPISTTTLFTLPLKHEDYLHTIDDVTAKYCSAKEAYTPSCEIFHGMRRLYIKAINTESNVAFDKYLLNARNHFCELRNSTDQCKIFKVLSDGLPPAFNAEGITRQDEQLDSEGTLRTSHIEVKDRLQHDRSEYLLTLNHVKQNYCRANTRSFFCQNAIGLVKNYKYSQQKSHDNTEFSSFLSRAHRDSCGMLQQSKALRRCKILDILRQDLPMSIKAETKLLEEQSQYVKSIQDVTAHYCTTPYTLFCQLSHGLLRHYLDAIQAHSTFGFKMYLEGVHLHSCVKRTNHPKRCDVLRVLKQQVPRAGIAPGTSIQKAEAKYAETKAALSQVENLRGKAEAVVKKAPTAANMQTLDDEAQEEAKAQKTVQNAHEHLIDQLAEQKYGAPSHAELEFHKEEAKQAAKQAVLALEHLSKVKEQSHQHVSALKSKASEAKLLFATATTAVEADPSASNVKAVQDALQSRAAAALAVNDAVKEHEKMVAKAEATLKEAEDAADRMRADSESSSLKRQKAVAEEKLQDVEKATARSKVEMLLAEVAVERAKAMKIQARQNTLAKQPSDEPEHMGTTFVIPDEAGLVNQLKTAQATFEQESSKLNQQRLDEGAVKKQVRDRQNVLATEQKLARSKAARDAAVKKRSAAEDVERDQKLMIKKSMQAKEIAEKKKATASTEEINAKKALTEAQAEISKQEHSAQMSTLKAQQEHSKAMKLQRSAKRLEKKAQMNQAEIANVTMSLDDSLQQGKAALSKAMNNKAREDAAAKTAQENLESAKMAKLNAEAREEKADEKDGGSQEKVEEILKKDSDTAEEAHKELEMARQAKVNAEKTLKKAQDQEKAKLHDAENTDSQKKEATAEIRTKAQKAQETAKKFEKEKKSAQAAFVQNSENSEVKTRDEASKDMKDAETETQKAKKAEAIAVKAREETKSALNAAKDKVTELAEACAAKKKALDKAVQAKKAVSNAEKLVSDTTDKRQKLQQKCQASDQELARKLAIASKAVAELKAEKEDIPKVDTKTAAENDLKQAQQKVKNAKNDLSELNLDPDAEKKSKVELKKAKDTVTSDKQKEQQLQDEATKAKESLKKAKEEVSKQTQKSEDLVKEAENAESKAAATAKKAEKAVQEAERAKQEAQKMVDDTKSDESDVVIPKDDAQKEANMALDEATKSFNKAESESATAKSEHAKALKALEAAKAKAAQTKKDASKKVGELTESKDAAEEKVNTNEKKVKAAVKAETKAQEAHEKAVGHAKKSKSLQHDAEKGEREIEAAQSRVTKATEDDKSRKAVEEKLKKALETERVAKQALEKKKSECAAAVKKFDSDIESASSKVDTASKVATQEQEAADKATAKAGNCESGNKGEVEELEDKLEKFNDKVEADKKKIADASKTEKKAKSDLDKAIDLETKKKKEKLTMEAVKKKSEDVNQRALKLQAEHRKLKAEATTASDLLERTKSGQSLLLQKLKANEVAAAKKVEETESKAKKADEKKAEAEKIAMDRNADEASRELAKSSFDSAAQTAAEAKNMVTASQAERKRAADTLSREKNEEHKTKANIKQAASKLNARKKAAADETKLANQMQQQSAQAQDKAREYASEAEGVQVAKAQAQARLMKAVKDGAKAKELVAKADIQEKQAEKSASSVPEAKAASKVSKVKRTENDNVEAAKRRQLAAKEQVEKAQAKSKAADRAAEQSQEMAEAKAKFQVKQTETEVTAAKNAVQSASEELAKNPTSKRIARMKEAESALAKEQVEADDATDMAKTFKVKTTSETSSSQRSHQSTTKRISRSTSASKSRRSHSSTDGTLWSDRHHSSDFQKQGHRVHGDAGWTTQDSTSSTLSKSKEFSVLIPFYCSKPKYAHLCKFYKALKRKGHLSQPIRDRLAS